MNIKALDYKDNGCLKTDTEEDKEVFLRQTKETSILVSRLHCSSMTSRLGGMETLV
jgi:hypothetical protein